ncbi:MAG: peptidoglycan-binding protein [Patescibacteria group bacterium]
MPKLKQKIVAGLLTFSLLASFAPTVFAAADFEPYDATFVISAYYSPLPNQRVYFRGTYAADVRLNGNGTNGADGTQVYPGMLAAPKTYPFGMKIEIPGLGVGAIHDRGGAIVLAGERTIATHDRLDVWMGRGEEGLARALQWGVRTVHAKVYPATATLAESFTLPSMSPVFVADLQIGSSGDTVTRLQNELKTYGYFQDEVDGTYDEGTAQAVLGYQLARKLVASADSAGAGILDSNTRASLNSELFQRSWTPPNSLLIATANAASGVSVAKTSTSTLASTSTKPVATAVRFPTTLTLGDRGALVREMQIALTEAGSYECEVNGVFDEKMEDCIFKFQSENQILANRTDFGAGFFGEKTREKLASLLDARDAEVAKLIADKAPTSTIDVGASGEAVTKLQTALRDLGFFAGEISGEYDAATEAAVLAFQTSKGIVASAASSGAGVFGPKTRAALTADLQSQLLATAELPTNPEWTRQTLVAYTPTFAASLSLGDSGEAVTELQKVLQKLGYSELAISGEFDEATELAVLDFQIKSEVLATSTESGAGSFGPKTRAAINSIIDTQQIALAA